MGKGARPVERDADEYARRRAHARREGVVDRGGEIGGGVQRDQELVFDEQSKSIRLVVWLDVFLVASRCRTCLSEACFQGVKLPGNSKQKQRESRLKSGWHRGYILTLVRVLRNPRRGMANTLVEYDSMSRRAGKSKVVGVQVFRGVDFNDWLRLFMQVRFTMCFVFRWPDMIFQYAFLLTKRGQYEIADEVLRHILVSNAYQSRERQDSIRLALISKLYHLYNIQGLMTDVSMCYSCWTAYRSCRACSETDNNPPV